jgi:competence protein ComGC
MSDDITRDDEIVLIDYLTGRLDPPEAETLRRRLESEDRLRQRRDTIARTFAAMDLAPRVEPPDDLVANTLAHIAAADRTHRLIASQQLARPRGYWHTFNLRELAAIAAVILIMVGVFVPSMQVARRRGNQNVCASQLGQIGAGLQTYAMNHDSVLPNADSLLVRWLPQGPEPVASNSAGPFKLVRGRYVAGPSVFQCPAVGGAGFTVRDDMTDFPSPEHVSYSYQHAVGGNMLRINDPAIARVLTQMAILADQTPIFRDRRFRPDRVASPLSENHGGRGMGVLYMAGNVRWADHARVGVEGDNIFLADQLNQYKGIETPGGPTDTFLLP